MARKNYSEEFRRDAVELYRVTEGATVAQIAADLGIADGSLSAWLQAAALPARKHGTDGPRATRRPSRSASMATPWPRPVRPRPMSKRPPGCGSGSASLKPNR